MSLLAPATAESRRKLIYGASTCALFVSISLRVFVMNGWPSQLVHCRGERLDNG